MKIREATIWILRTLSHSLSVPVLLPGPYAGSLIFLFNYFQLEKKKKRKQKTQLCGPGPSFPWRRQEEASRFLSARLLEASLTLSSAEKGAVPALVRERLRARPWETAAPFQAIGFSVYAKGPEFCEQNGIQGSMCFAYRWSHPARSALWMCVWETSESPFFLLLWSPSQINLRSSMMQEFSRLVGMGNSRPMRETGIWKNATHDLVTESRFERQ